MHYLGEGSSDKWQTCCAKGLVAKCLHRGAEVRLAEQWHALLPAAPMELIMNNRLPPGCRLVNLHSEISTPGSEEHGHEHVFINNVFGWLVFFAGVPTANLQEISHNYNWLQPVCAENPEKISWYFILKRKMLKRQGSEHVLWRAGSCCSVCCIERLFPLGSFRVSAQFHLGPQWVLFGWRVFGVGREDAQASSDTTWWPVQSRESHGRGETCEETGWIPPSSFQKQYLGFVWTSGSKVKRVCSRS